jgi:hypothetical protein
MEPREENKDGPQKIKTIVDETEKGFKKKPNHLGWVFCYSIR